MNKRNVYFWYISLVLLASSIIPFIKLMNTITLKNVCITAIWLAITTVIYVLITKLITHKKGYTAIEAIIFYNLCKKNGIKKKQLYQSSRELEKIASQRDYSKKLELKDLYEMYNIGYTLSNEKWR